MERGTGRSTWIAARVLKLSVVFRAGEESEVIRTATGLSYSVFGGIWGTMCVTVSGTFVPTAHFLDRKGTGWLT